MLFKAPLTSNSKFSTREARAVSVWRRSSPVEFPDERSSISDLASSMALVMASMFEMKVAAAVSFWAADESELRPAAVSSG